MLAVRATSSGGSVFYYASRLEPRAPALSSQPASFDPLAAVLREAGAAGLAVHAWANVTLVFQVYRLMFNFGTLFVPIGLLGLLMYWRKGRVFEARWVLWLFVITVFLAEMGITAGWWTAEIGRQPWIVYNELLTALAGSPTLTTAEVAISMVMFIGLYTLLFILFIYLLNGKIQAGPEPLEEVESVPVASLPDTFRQVFRRRGARAS